MFSKIVSMFVLVLLLLSTGCAAAPTETTPAEPVTLTVLAAASLTESFTEIGALFESQNPGVTVAFSFAGSQALEEQLAQGAEADVFASASQKYMTAAVDASRVNADDAQGFAMNRLVVIYPIGNPAGITQLSDLAKPGLKIDLADQSVPFGQYTLDFLDKAAADPNYGDQYKEAVLANVVSYEENVKAVLSKISLGEADAGVVYISDITLEASSTVGRLDIPDALNTIATYPIAPISDSANADLAKAFIALVLFPEGQQILANYNFVPVNQN